MRQTAIAFVLFAILTATGLGASTTRQSEPGIATAGNGEVILSPVSKAATQVTAEGQTIAVPHNMVFVPTSDFLFGTGTNARRVHLDGYCIGKFSVTNSEYKAFLDATHMGRPPGYWRNGIYPEGKGNHPVAFVSLVQAKAYAQWVSKETDWKIVIPTSEQWEHAARGPDGYLYPWGNSVDVQYAGGEMKSRFNFNGIVAAHFLSTEPKREVSYNHPRSKYAGQKTTIDQIAGFDDAGRANTLSIGQNGSVRGWVNHNTYTGFIYTDLFTSLNEAGGYTTPVGQYESGKSGYGCYDMAGNIWNWCDTQIVATNGAEKGKTVNEIRGGSWYATSMSCKSISIGEGRAASGAYNTVGFRIAMIPYSEHLSQDKPHN